MLKSIAQLNIIIIFAYKNFKKQRKMNKEFPTYRLKNQKNKGYKGLYKKLFSLLNKDSIFSECYEENSWYEGEDMIVQTTWSLECDLPKGIEEYK